MRGDRESLSWDGGAVKEVKTKGLTLAPSLASSSPPQLDSECYLL